MPKEPEKDSQLQYALKLLRGQIPEPTPADKKPVEAQAKPGDAKDAKPAPAPAPKN